MLAALALEVSIHMDETELVDAVFQWLIQITNAQLAAVYLYNPERDTLRIASIADTRYGHVGGTMSLDVGVLGEAVRRRTTIYTNDYQASPLKVTDQPLQAVAVSPLIARDQLLGAISIGFETDQKFNEEDIRILTRAASQVATVLDNQRLFKAEEQKTHQLRLLNAITYAANSIRNYDELLQYLADTLNTLFDSAGCFIALWDQENQVPIPLAATTSLRKRFLAMKLAPHTPNFAVHIMAANRPIWVPRVLGSDIVNQTLIEQFSLNAILGLPLTLGNNRLGTAFIGFEQTRHLTQAEIDFSAQVADQISLVMTKAHLLAGERRQRFLAETQLTFSNLLLETTSAAEAGLALLESIGTLMDYDSGSVILMEGNGRTGNIVASAGYTDPEAARNALIPVDEFPLLQELYTTIEPLYIPDLQRHQDWQPGSTPDSQEVHTTFLIPLQHRKKSIVGHVTLKSFQFDAFSPEDRSQVTLLCNQAAAALQNQRLLRRSQRQSAELSAANADLQHINQIREEFVHNASHELRTPLTFIQGYAGMLADNMLGDLTPEQLDAVQIILARAESMNAMIQEMVDYQKADSTPLRRQEVDVYALVDGCIRAAQITARQAGVRFTMTATSTLPTIHADAQQLGQVIDNLFSNAIKFSHVGGQVAVTLSVHEKQIRIDIADQGVGIPADQLDLIWNRFYRVKDTAQKVRGSGLGLAIVHHIIQAHGGRIWAESPGVGSVFHIELPVGE